MKKSLFKVAVLSIALTVLSCKSTSDRGPESNSQRPEKKERHEGGKGERGQRPSASQIISEMDANSDGKLSESEVKGPIKNDFSKIDTDGDGFLTEEELENAPKPERGGGQRK